MHRTRSWWTHRTQTSSTLRPRAARFSLAGWLPACLALGAVLACSAGGADAPSNASVGATGGDPTAPTATTPTPTTEGTTPAVPVPGSSGAVAVPMPTGTTPSGVVMENGEPTFVDEPVESGLSGGFLPTEKVDLLFVIDNSNSMADKQAIFKEAIPDMIRQMANPPCVEKDMTNMKQRIVGDSVDGRCEVGSPIFKPVTDIHIGVISSSLGARGLLETEADGGFNCRDAVAGENDRAWMLGRARPALNPDSYQGFGFLVWDPDQTANPPGDPDLQTLITKFEAQVTEVGETGCGYEAPLEAAYRFLSEPDPYESVTRVNCPGQADGNLCAEPAGLDSDLLAQRAAFLRPDSVVVVMFLTDENDCSIKTRGQGYLTMALGQLKNGTNACELDPNSECCAPCGRTLPATCDADPATNGCSDPVVDVFEAKPIRCFEQQARYGVSFLRSTQVYVGGFVFPLVGDRMGQPQPNSLITADRGREKIFVVGILGVPWQDTATPETVAPDEQGSLDLVEASKVDWTRFLSPAPGQLPADPFNDESLDPRPATVPHPVTGETIGGPGTWNTINGHDRVLAANDTFDDDLQYSCIFPLPQPRDCTTATGYCDCAPPTEEGQAGFDGNPLCYDAATATYTSTQVYAKAYPSPRMLEVLKGVSCPPDPETMLPTECTDQSVLASICPRQVSDKTKLDYGYRPVIRALLLNVASRLVR